MKWTVWVVCTLLVLPGCEHLNRYEQEMLDMTSWQTMRAGDLAELLVALCSSPRAEWRHHWQDHLETVKLLRINCVGDERYNDEKPAPQRYGAAVMLGERLACTSEVAVPEPRARRWVASACGVSWKN